MRRTGDWREICRLKRSGKHRIGTGVVKSHFGFVDDVPSVADSGEETCEKEQRLEIHS
ncbi:hypothetical protein PM082_020821 [Marasmius tenuissimus]|nr:hypothetical protein PM082_020821 [Marasmius tenuissimus]